MPDALPAYFRRSLLRLGRVLTRNRGVFAYGALSFLAVILSSFGTPAYFASCAPGGPNARPYKVRTVVIDAGHGGKDRGCNGKDAFEADIALKLALAVGRKIEDSMADVKVIYTRKTDVFIELIERAEIANRANADVFISLHLNSGPSSARGTELWVMGPAKSGANLAVAKRENEVVLQEADYKKNYGGFDPHSPQSHILFSLFQSAYIENSLRLAQATDRQLRATGRPSRGIKQAGFIVLWKTAMPSILIESGFLTNRQDENFLNTSAGQNTTASAIFTAFRAYKRQLEKLD
jgi:N-acetylmuramoyl-L-alanine amidase